jgi:hypothetical protein
LINKTNDSQLIQSHQLKSRCFINDITGKFKFQEVTWTVQSHQGKKKKFCFCFFFIKSILDVNADERFYSCVSSIDNYISLNVQTAVGLDQMSIDVFSYFYDIANDAGLLTIEDQSSSVISIFMFRFNIYLFVINQRL